MLRKKLNWIYSPSTVTLFGHLSLVKRKQSPVLLCRLQLYETSQVLDETIFHRYWRLSPTIQKTWFQNYNQPTKRKITITCVSSNFFLFLSSLTIVHLDDRRRTKSKSKLLGSGHGETNCVVCRVTVQCIILLFFSSQRKTEKEKRTVRQLNEATRRSAQGQQEPSSQFVPRFKACRRRLETNVIRPIPIERERLCVYLR